MARTKTQILFNNASGCELDVRGQYMRLTEGPTLAFAEMTATHVHLGARGGDVAPATAYLKRAGLVVLTSDIAPGYVSYGLLVRSPYASVPTGTDGAYEISAVPPGTYTVSCWHEGIGLRPEHKSASRLRYERDGPIVVQRELTVERGKAARLDFVVPVRQAWRQVSAKERNARGR